MTSRTSGEITEPVGEEHARATQENSTPGANGQGEDRISSGETLPEYLKRLFNLSENRLVPWKKIAVGLLKVDPGCLLHGIWFNESSFAGGKVRITRALSGYIEARDPSTANFGFQKRDPVSDRTDKDAGQSAAEGYGSVIGPKQHFTSPEVKAYFQIDLERLRSYGLLQKEVHALAAWGIYKIRRVLVASRDGVADLRTECKFETAAIVAQVVDQETGKKTPFPLPELGEDLKQAFDVLKMSTGPLCVRWVPSIQGKAEMPESVNDNELSRQGLEAKVKVETPKPKRGKKETKPAKRFLILSGEWSESDKRKLREQNPNDPTKSVIEKALADFERNWEAKAQSRKADESDADDQDRDGDQE